jgi:glycosyltransferase involved in cell wall biosynthesis
MSPDLTIALCLRDDESRLADMSKAAVEVAETLASEYATGEWADSTRLETLDADGDPRGDAWTADADLGDLQTLEYELLALDESSRDNTLSVLSILHAKLPRLRTIQGLAPGTAVMRTARAAQGRVWLIVDAPFEPEHGLWAARQVFCGDRAAMVPGEVLAVHRNLGQAALGWMTGGLVSAQHEVERMLDSHGQRPAWSPPRERALRARARLFVRGRLGRIGLGQFDRRS